MLQSIIEKTALFMTLALFLHSSFADDSVRSSVDALLDGFHKAAAEGDKRRYLASFAPGAVFMGTDDWERWPLPEFRKYVDKRFVDGKGWEYHSVKRYVSFSADGNTGWFDEIMVSDKWGRFRGTGVVVKQSDEWKIAFYSLSFLIPNEVWEQTSELASNAFGERE